MFVLKRLASYIYAVDARTIIFQLAVSHIVLALVLFHPALTLARYGLTWNDAAVGVISLGLACAGCWALVSRNWRVADAFALGSAILFGVLAYDAWNAYPAGLSSLVSVPAFFSVFVLLRLGDRHALY